MSITTEQQQQYVNAFTEFQKAILPAVLDAENQKNGYLLGSWLTERGLEVTAENLVKSANAQVTTLKWTVLPRKLQLIYENDRLAQTPNQLQDEADLVKRVRAQEQKEATAKADAENFRAAALAISAFAPVRGNRLAFGVQEQEQKRMRQTVENSKGKHSSAAILKWVQDEVARLYKENERERL
jgi:hypothetical protein